MLCMISPSLIISYSYAAEYAVFHCLECRSTLRLWKGFLDSISLGYPKRWYVCKRYVTSSFPCLKYNQKSDKKKTSEPQDGNSYCFIMCYISRCCPWPLSQSVPTHPVSSPCHGFESSISCPDRIPINPIPCDVWNVNVSLLSLYRVSFPIYE